MTVKHQMNKIIYWIQLSKFFQDNCIVTQYILNTALSKLVTTQLPAINFFCKDDTITVSIIILPLPVDDDGDMINAVMVYTIL